MLSVCRPFARASTSVSLSSSDPPLIPNSALIASPPPWSPKFLSSLLGEVTQFPIHSASRRLLPAVDRSLGTRHSHCLLFLGMLVCSAPPATHCRLQNGVQGPHEIRLHPY